MSSKAIVVIVILVLVIAGYIVLQRGDLPVPPPSPSPTPSPTPGDYWAIYTDPASVKVSSVGQQFTVKIMVNMKGDGLVAWDVNITFNNIVVNAVSFAEGPFLKDVCGQTWMVSEAPGVGINNERGYVDLACTMLGDNKGGAKGVGCIFTVTFQILAKQSSKLVFDKVMLVGTDYTDMCETHGGTKTNCVLNL